MTEKTTNKVTYVAACDDLCIKMARLVALAQTITSEDFCSFSALHDSRQHDLLWLLEHLVMEVDGAFHRLMDAEAGGQS